MEKYTHIAFGASAAGNLKHFLANNETNFCGNVINLSDDLSVGPLFEIGDEEQFSERIEYLLNMRKVVSNATGGEDLEVNTFKEDITKMYMELISIPEDNTIIVWHGSNSNDWVGFSYVLSVYKDRDMYAINVSEFESEEPIMSLAQMSDEMIGESTALFAKISNNEKNGISGIWGSFTKGKIAFRVLDEQGLGEVRESHFDEMILDELSSEYIVAATAIGNVMSTYNGFISDLTLSYRVHELIKNEKLESRGELSASELYEIKKK